MAHYPFLLPGTTASTELRTDGGGGFVGFWFENTSGEPIVITKLGRWQRAGNTQTHSLRVYQVTTSGAAATLLGSVSVNCSGATVDAWLEGTLSFPITIELGVNFLVVSEEFTGGDTFGNNGGTAFVTSDIGNTWSGYISGANGIRGSDSNRGYGPVNFWYSSPEAIWTKSGNVYTTNGTRFSCQSAVNDASTDDIIDIPAGSFTWGAGGAYLNLNKAVTLHGAGTGSTTLVVSNSAATYTNGVIRISAGGTVKNMTITQEGGVSNYPTAISVTNTSGFRITNVIYNSAGHVGYGVYFNGVFGLIDNCVINGGAGDDEWIFGQGPSDAWQSASNKGTVSAVFVEDCTMTGQGYLDANANASVVVRNCTITPTTGYIKLDGHGTATNSPPRSFRLMEAYRNTWTTSNPGAGCFEIRGGTAFIWDNVSVDGPIYLGDYRIVYGTNTVGDYPLYDQPGTGQDPFPASAATEPLYLWNNTRSGGAAWVASQAIFGTSMVGLVNPDRDYFETDATFDGTSGVGRGTRAQMDAITPTLTGVGFWVTDEGSWDTTLPAGTSGRLYRWNGSAWALYYTPYTYPHPLIGGLSAPAITADPEDQSASVGDDVTFSVSATGNPSPTFQWRKDGAAISGATSSSLLLEDVTLSDQGEYDCIVLNSEGLTTSASATLTVTTVSSLNPLGNRGTRAFVFAGY